MTRNGCTLAAALFAVGLVASACGGSTDSGTTTVTETVSGTTTAASSSPEATTTSSSAAPATTASGAADLQSLIPTPADTQRTDGPDSIQESGIHLHFLVNGAPLDVMDTYKTGLERGGWSLTVENSGGGGGGGGATYTGTNGDAYGVFVGGGYGSKTDVNSCVWPTKPSKANCGRN